MTDAHPRYRERRRSSPGGPDDVHDRTGRGVLRACTIPGCGATYDAASGPPPGERWLRKSSPEVLLCPDHAWLFTNHAPRLDHEARTCTCACGWHLPGPTLGNMGDAWIAHAIARVGGGVVGHQCEHNVELDMCDTWECAQKLNPNWPNNLKEN